LHAAKNPVGLSPIKFKKPEMKKLIIILISAGLISACGTGPDSAADKIDSAAKAAADTIKAVADTAARKIDSAFSAAADSVKSKINLKADSIKKAIRN
jgi:PBP1b-binding outer membrane lipoprotein LpoB